jgi:PKD repeat protein
MAIAGVVGHGVGIVDGEPGVKIFLATPGVAGVPSRLDDIPVAVEVTGMFVAGGTTDKTSPAPNGYSVGHPNITAGTLGAVVRDASNQCYILSNNHVLADVNNAAIGDNTLQPGPFDGGQNPQDAIASLADYEPIDLSGGDNEMDAAISAIFPAADVTGSAPGSSDSPPAYGTPSETATDASVGLDVQKFGRTTLWTHGEIDTENVTASICYECAGPFCRRCKAAATFVNLLSIPDATATDANGNPANFSDGGDSGSLIVTETGSNPTALLFAGSSTRTLAHPIQPVLTRFGVEVETDLNQCTGGGTPSNLPPTADFSFTTLGLTADFTDGSSDSDGSVVGWSWDFGDGNGSTAQNPPSHTYAASGTYSVSLTVTDDDGDTDALSQNVTVTDGGAGGISLNASGYKVRGLKKADLDWSGANSTNVDLYRDGALITTTANDGAYTDNIDQRGGGSYTYAVCEAGTGTCSNEAVVAF